MAPKAHSLLSASRQVVISCYSHGNQGLKGIHQLASAQPVALLSPRGLQQLQLSGGDCNAPRWALQISFLRSAVSGVQSKWTGWGVAWQVVGRGARAPAQHPQACFLWINSVLCGSAPSLHPALQHLPVWMLVGCRSLYRGASQMP